MEDKIMDTKIIKNKMREYEIKAINEKYENFDEQKLQKILNSIKDTRFFAFFLYFTAWKMLPPVL